MFQVNRMEWSHPQLKQKHKTVFNKPFVNSKCLFPDVNSNRLQWVSLSNREGGGKMPHGPHKHTYTRKTAWTCVVQSISLSLDTWGSQQCTNDSGMQYIYKRNGWWGPTSLRWDLRFQTSFLPMTLICLILWSLIEILHKVCKERKQGTIPGLHVVTDNSKGLKSEHFSCGEWKTQSHFYETICKCL